MSATTSVQKFEQRSPAVRHDASSTLDATRAKNEILLEQRAIKRADTREKRHKLAEELRKSAAELFEKGDYAAASVKYLEATVHWTSNPQYYLDLSSAYLKCECYAEAAHAATRALSLDPKLIEARFQRGVARMEQRLLKAAQIDFESVLKHKPNHADAERSFDAILKMIEASSKLGTHNVAAPSALPVETEGDVDFDFPQYDDEKLEIASVSDSSDCNHAGNGIGCRFYNHQGCSRGSECAFSHAPDEKSVRDDLGRNVCIYFLLSACKFGESKCVYSHTREYLPKGHGWWNDEAQTAKVKQVLELADKRWKERKTRDSLLASLDVARTKREQGKGGKGKKSAGGASGKKSATTPRAKERFSNVDTDKMEQRMMNGGFTDSEVEELLAQGVKPWDDDAHAVLAALSM